MLGEPQDEENYYLFIFYRNDSLILYNPTDIYYSCDQVLAEKMTFHPTSTTMVVECLDPSFGTRSSLTNGALGFFQVSAVQDKEIYIRIVSVS